MRKQLVIGYSSTIAVACLGLAFTSYYVSFFGKESYVLIALLLTIISAIQNLDGLQKPLVNEYVKASVGRRDLTDVIKSALCFSALIGLVAVVIFYLSLRFFVDNLTTYEFIYISVSGAIFIFLFFYLTPMNAFFIFANQPHLNQLWKLVVYGSLYIVFFICTKIYGDGPMLLVALGFSGFLGFLFIYSVSRNTFVPSFNVFPSISRFFRIFILGIGMNLAIFLFLFVDKIFLYGLPAADMADYLIPFELMSKFAVVHAIFGGALLGKISQYSVRSGGDFDALDYFKSAIFYVGIISVISINLVLYGKDFFNIWLGLEVTTQMIVVYYVFIVSFFLNSFGWLGFNILLLEGKLRIVTIAYIAMLVVLIVACLFLSGLLVKPKR